MIKLRSGEQFTANVQDLASLLQNELKYFRQKFFSSLNQIKVEQWNIQI